MASRAETTFGDLQTDERFKKLERSLKLALLKKERSKSVRTGEVTWPSVSSINVDTLDSSCTVVSQPTSLIRSEVLTSSNNLRNVLLRKKNHNVNREIMATSSVKQCNVEQNNHFDQLVMPPPAGNTVYRTAKEPQNRICASSYGKAASTPLNSSVQSFTVNTYSLESTPSCISANTNGKEYRYSYVTPMNPTNESQQINRVFSRWRVMLNDQYELIIKGTLECGRLARSKPVIRRYTATCVESKFKHKYRLQGNIVDEKNGLPDYIRGKFYNGFPDDWENVYQIWRTYVSQGCPVTFRWPTPITDSDDDLKSELTDLTYVRNKTIPRKKSYESAEYIEPESPSSKSPKKCHNCSSHSFQNYEMNTSFVKPFTSNAEKDIIPIAQTKNIKSVCDEDNEQNIRSNVNSPCTSSKMNKLQDIFQEDKLNIIIKNLADRNCSPKYIDKIIEMFNCLDYVVSYRTGSEYNYDSAASTSRETSKSKAIPLQQNLTCNDNRMNIDKFENRTIQLKSYTQSTDLGYGSIRNDSNPTQLLNPISIEPQCDDNKDSDKSESETYAGIPKISIERVLKPREASEKIYRRKVRKKTVQPEVQNYAAHSHHNAREVELAIPDTDVKKSLPYNESYVSITEDEVEITSVIKKPHKMIFSNHQEMQRNNPDVYEGNKPVMPVQNERSLDAFELQNLPTKSENAAKKSKPTIISSMPVNLNLRICNAVSTSAQSHDSDVSIVEKQCANIQLSEKAHKKKSVSKTSTATKPAVIVNDPRSKTVANGKKEVRPITNDKNESENIDSIDATKSTTNPTTEQSKSSKIEVKDNHKVLTAWMPKVVYYAKSKSALGLTFEGKLLNEAGHVMHRKFMTDIVLKRLSATLIETVNHEFYELFGHLNDNKHIIPRELAKQCRNGCPTKIEQFCVAWKTLQRGEVQKIGDKLHNISVDFLNAPVSSRGRKIVPPLCYWKGERIILKDNTPIYSPGNSQESSLTSLTENSKEALNIEEEKEQKTHSRNTPKKQTAVNKQKPLLGSNEVFVTNRNPKIVIEKIQSYNKSPKAKTANGTIKSDNIKKSWKSAVNKRRITQKLTFSSTDSSEEEQASPSKRTRKSQRNANANASSYPMTLRKRQKVETFSNGTSRRHYATYCSPTRKSGHNITYSYYKGISPPKDFLSETEASII